MGKRAEADPRGRGGPLGGARPPPRRNCGAAGAPLVRRLRCWGTAATHLGRTLRRDQGTAGGSDEEDALCNTMEGGVGKRVPLSRRAPAVRRHARLGAHGRGASAVSREAGSTVMVRRPRPKRSVQEGKKATFNGQSGPPGARASTHVDPKTPDRPAHQWTPLQCETLDPTPHVNGKRTMADPSPDSMLLLPPKQRFAVANGGGAVVNHGIDAINMENRRAGTC